MPQNAVAVSPAQAFAAWLRAGLLSFGGPAARIAPMHREIIATRGCCYGGTGICFACPRWPGSG